MSGGRYRVCRGTAATEGECGPTLALFACLAPPEPEVKEYNLRAVGRPAASPRPRSRQDDDRPSRGPVPGSFV